MVCNQPGSSPAYLCAFVTSGICVTLCAGWQSHPCLCDALVHNHAYDYALQGMPGFVDDYFDPLVAIIHQNDVLYVMLHVC